MSKSSAADLALMTLVRTVAAGEAVKVSQLLASEPALVSRRFGEGATRAASKPFYLETVRYYVYAGCTALHVAAAAYRASIAQELVRRGADVRAKDRRGAEPLHAAAVGIPDSPLWDPHAQATTIAYLIEAGADPNAVDAGGVTPLHRAVRTRCASAVRTLLDHGADAHRKNGSGSTPMRLAMVNSGRGGSGSSAAKAQLQEILALLHEHGAAP